MKTKILSTFFAIAIIFVSCEKDKTELPVEFKFVLLDTLGIEKTVFNQGENIIFSFQVINKSSEDLIIGNFFPNDDFFRAYQQNTIGGTLDYGKPYDAVCEIGSFPIHAKNKLVFKCPWKDSNNDAFYCSCLLTEKGQHNDVLPIGNFYTEFSQSFKIGEIQTEEKHFKINFTVK